LFGKKVVFAEAPSLNFLLGNCTNPYGKTKFFMEEIMKDVVAANPDWGCQLLRYIVNKEYKLYGTLHCAMILPIIVP
jgi:UDP-glucose 4-epimerase